MEIIKIIVFILLLLILIVVGLSFYKIYKLNNAKDYKELEKSVDKQIKLYISKENAIGIVVGIVKNGKTIIKGYGTAEKGKEVLPTSHSIFELASVSKLFATSTLQILVDEKIVNLDDSIQTLLREKVELPKSTQNTTLRHLATHLSGFPRLPNSLFVEPYIVDETNPYKHLVTQDLYDYLKTCEGKKAEGKFEYSNLGMGLLGHILGVKTNTSYEEIVKQKLLKPLEMNDTFVTIEKINKDKIVQQYNENNEPTPIWKDNVLTGAGSFLSNALDMVKFIKANLDEQETKISKSLIKTHQQQLNGQTGLGWIVPPKIYKLLGNKNIVWHNGMTAGSASFIAVNKENNYGLVLLSNKGVDITKLGMKLSLVIKTQSWNEEEIIEN